MLKVTYFNLHGNWPSLPMPQLLQAATTNFNVGKVLSIFRAYHLLLKKIRNTDPDQISKYFAED